MRVAVRPELCCSSGMCLLNAPEVFDQTDEDGTVVLLAPHPSPEQRGAVRQAASLCPVGAIEIKE
ncbi:ferredoxin [Amycolatopsis magusensis]|uniref:Ferredoxin n=1 Tax=Amycolatopsis magusensis TaxID=882444 RepID=A0ABS4PLX5_9PSEU|nr:ferredoxin [Amycolatopsis magusensis]MBP2180435.1 ferredoxin [Amycolatopsis magusensis]MDI5982617.1 ferredoxin [Amycolatopsis magusensis]